MKSTFLAALMNFFFMGLGTLYIGKRKLFGLALTIGAIALTYVELSLKPVNMQLYMVMFSAVLFVNIFFAIDGWREANEVNKG